MQEDFAKLAEEFGCGGDQAAWSDGDIDFDGGDEAWVACGLWLVACVLRVSLHVSCVCRYT